MSYLYNYMWHLSTFFIAPIIFNQAVKLEITFCVQGVITAPWGVPLIGFQSFMFSSISCLRKSSIKWRILPSLTLSLMRSIRRSCGIESNDMPTWYPSQQSIRKQSDRDRGYRSSTSSIRSAFSFGFCFLSTQWSSPSSGDLPKRYHGAHPCKCHQSVT